MLYPLPLYPTILNPPDQKTIMKNWFDQLSAVQLKDLAKASKLPVSGSKEKLQERLKACDLTTQYGSSDVIVADIQTLCVKEGISTSGTRYELVLRLLSKRSGVSMEKNHNSKNDENKAPKPRKVLEGAALDKRVDYRLMKLQKEIKNKLKWKPSFKYSGSKIRGGRVSIDCPETEVARAMFLNLKENKKTGKMSLAMTTDDEIYDAGLEGLGYRYGACANLKAPARINFADGILTFSFKYEIDGVR